LAYAQSISSVSILCWEAGISLMTGGLFSFAFAAYEHFAGSAIPGLL
jgi:hypothetical protein